MLVAWGLAYLHVIDMASDLPPDLKTGITVGYMAYAILGVMLGAFASLVFAFIPDSVKLFGNPLKYVLPAYIDAILRVPYTIYMIWKLKPLKNIKYGTAVPTLREQFQQMENPAAYFNAGLLFIVAFIARSFSEVYAPLYGASNPAVFVWDLWTNSLYFTLLSLICMVLLKPTSLKLVCRPFYLVTRNLGCWKYRNAEGTVLVNGAVFFMILALVGCLVLIDYTYQPTASSGSASSSVISLGQFIVGISLIYLFGGALMYEATGGMAQHVPVQSPHAFFLGAATSFQMIGRTIGPVRFRFDESVVFGSSLVCFLFILLSLFPNDTIFSNFLLPSKDMGGYCLRGVFSRSLGDYNNLYDGKLSNLWSNWRLSPNIGTPYSSDPSIVGI